MNIAPDKSITRTSWASLRPALLSGGLMLAQGFCITPASALNYEVGEATVRANFTLGAGASWRTEDPYTDATTPNFKSETTFDSGLVSSVLKATAELQVDWRNWGAVVNMNYVYDSQIMQHGTGRAGVYDPDFLFGLTSIDTGMGNRWNKGAKDVSGSNFDLLDAYIYGLFLEDALDVRLGLQVINWGEGLFFLDSVAVQTPININKLVLPGSELKEAFIGLGALRGQWALNDTWSLDAYYQWDWDENTLPGVGTFYGDDVAGPGGQEEWANDSLLPGLRGPDNDASDSGQWGISTRAFLGDVELGLYYSRFHEKFPLLTFGSNAASPLLATVLYYTPELNGGITPEIWEMIGVLGPEDLIGFPVPGTELQQSYLEDNDIFAASIAFSLGSFSINGEIGYRPDRPLLLPPSEYLLVQDGNAWSDDQDTITASVHALWLGGQFWGGIDSQFAAIQLGVDYVSDPDGLAPNQVITRDPFASVDDTAWGLAASWDGTWQSVASRNINLTLNLFAQYDFSGNSHYWGNFAEDRLQYSVGLTASFGNAWEANINYAGNSFSESQFQNQDTVNLSVNYKF